MTSTNKSDALLEISTRDDVQMVAPALERYTQNVLVGDLWKRPDLSQRDRSLVTLGVLIARNQTTELPSHLNLALDNGVKASEISEVITHLAFYSGWANACRRLRSRKKYFVIVESEPISFLRPQVRFFLSTRRRRRGARPSSRKVSGRWLRESCNTPATHCFMICGCVRRSRRETGASLRSARSSPPVRSRNSRLTLTGQWITA